MSKEFRKASDVITALFNGFDPANMEKANAFSRSWRDLVGEKIAAHSRVVDVDRGAVIVEVDHPGWSQQLHFRKAAVLSALSRGYPDLGIKTLVVRVVAERDVTYARPATPVGEGLSRAWEEPPPDVPVDERLDDPLKDVLSRLKESIRKGKRGESENDDA